MKRTLNHLNTYALEVVHGYMNLDIYGHTVFAQYFMNNIGNDFIDLMRNKKVPYELVDQVADGYKNKEIPFGWYRGKGTPSQLEKATCEINQKIKSLPIKKASSEGIVSFMKAFGIGVDCSGFVFNVFAHAFEKVGMKKEFVNSLSWKDPKKQDIDHAGVFVFGGEASNKIDIEKCRPLDIFVIRNQNRYFHIALVLMEKNKLVLAQSALITNPPGVTKTPFRINRKEFSFGFTPTIGDSWEKLYKRGSLELRRLKILQSVW